jgi:hypothetical protein
VTPQPRGAEGEEERSDAVRMAKRSAATRCEWRRGAQRRGANGEEEWNDEERRGVEMSGEEQRRGASSEEKRRGAKRSEEEQRCGATWREQRRGAKTSKDEQRGQRAAKGRTGAESIEDTTEEERPLHKKEQGRC